MATAGDAQDRSKPKASFIVRVNLRGEGSGEVASGEPPTVGYIEQTVAAEVHRVTGYTVTATAERADK